MSSNYKQIPALIETLTPFTGNSMRGERWGNDYRIYSYTTLIATHNGDTGERWVSPTRYSVTTSRQQNIIKRAWGVN